MGVSFKPVWFDSLGAKSSCTLVKTPDISVLIDPGIAVMHPGFPAGEEEKIRWAQEGRRAIKRAVNEARVVVISHYHYDHYFPDDMKVYENKLLLAKNPNEYINDSQRRRAESFYSRVCEHFGGVELSAFLRSPEAREYADPLEELPRAMHRDFGSYSQRRRQLLKQGMSLLKRRRDKWSSTPGIQELKFSALEVRYPEGREMRFGDTRLRFTRPLFHGIEFSRLGWVFATVVEHGGEKFIHSSDVNGPIIEDYAEWLIRENPDILVLDGPMTYMLGYMLNRINLNRAIENVLRIIRESDTELIIYDHHLPRDARFKQNTQKIWDAAEKYDKRILTAAEFLGITPRVLEATA
ncbi:MBL fold metallo-hydrolase [Candidatus Pyrohabitans sp.]